jgi:hypothetical protein
MIGRAIAAMSLVPRRFLSSGSRGLARKGTKQPLLRKSSTSAPMGNAATAQRVLTTEEKAAEVCVDVWFALLDVFYLRVLQVQKELWPRMKKYMVLIVPTVIGVVTSVFVISVPSARYFVESHFPKYGTRAGFYL